MIVALNGASAPSSNAPMTSFPPACAALGATEAAPDADADAGGTDAAAVLAAGVPVAPAGPHAASTAPAATAPPAATPSRRRSRRVRYRVRMSSSLIASLLLAGSSADRRPDGQPSFPRARRSRPAPDRGGHRRARPA